MIAATRQAEACVLAVKGGPEAPVLAKKGLSKTKDRGAPMPICLSLEPRRGDTTNQIVQEGKKQEGREWARQRE